MVTDLTVQLREAQQAARAQVADAAGIAKQSVVNTAAAITRIPKPSPEADTAIVEGVAEPTGAADTA